MATITQWTFEGDVFTPSTGMGTASTLGTTATFATGNPAGRGWNTTSYPAQGVDNKTDGVQFAVPTGGFNSIAVSFDLRHSNTAANTVVFQYSTDGNNFTDSSTFRATAGDTFFTRTVDLSGIPALNNNPSVIFRVVSAFDPPTSAAYVAANPVSVYGGGTMRYDNFTVTGTAGVVVTPSLTLTVNPSTFAENVANPAAVATLTRSDTSTSGLIVNLSSNDTTEATVPTTVSFVGNNTTVQFNVTAVDDLIVDGNQSVIITASIDGFISGTSTLSVTDNEVSITLISAIQGTGTASSLVGQTITIEGIVVGDFQGTNQIGGFFVQEEDADADTNPLTSEGISVFSSTAVNVGDRVRVTGTVAEFGFAGRSLTQLGNSSTVTVISTSNTLPTAAVVDLPVSAADGLERFEGMRVTIPETLTVSETFTLARFGEIQLSADGRRFQPTEFVDPNDNPASGTSSSGTSNVAAVTAQQNLNNLRAIVLDDGISTQNPATIPYLNAQNTRRIGDTTTGLTGILEQRFGSATVSGYRIQPTGNVTFADTNPRPLTPPSVGNANVKVGSFNVLNYFTTIDNGINQTGPGNNLDPRGAENLTEFNRQRDKTSTTIAQLNADVLGLIELENNGITAITDLVNAVNAKAGAGTYAFISDPVGYTANPGGTDAIKVAFIYKPSVVTPIGNAISPINETAFNLARAPIAQTFLLNSNGAVFTPLVNHFKSKGSSAGLPGDTDQGDGQALSNASRKAQSTAVINFINNTVIPTAKDADVLVLGDLNAYGEEDPVDLFRNAGFIDQIDRFDGNNISYSFVFQGQSGRLDHVLATPQLNSQVTGAAEWHINADEPIFLDYNLNFRAGGIGSGSTPDFFNSTIPFRASDHDPALVGLNLTPSPSTAAVGNVISRPTFNGGTLSLGTNSNDNITATTGSDTIAAFAGNDLIFGADGNDSIDGGFGDDTVQGGNGADTLIGNIGNDSIVGGAGADFLVGGAGNDFFVYNSFTEGGDTISDFASGDKILIRANAFNGLSAVNLVVDGSFGSATPGFLFNSVSKLLSFDADGNGFGLPVAIATLNNLPTLSTSDIILL